MSVMQGNSIAWGRPKQKAHAIIWGNSLRYEYRMHNYDENMNYRQFLGRHYWCCHKWVWKD
jgi:hypothetical protein